MTHPIKRHEHLVQEQERIKKQLQELEKDKAYKDAIDFQKAIEEVLEMYDKSKDELLELFGDAPAKKTGRSSRKAATPKPTRHYRNPHNGETVQAKSFRNATLREWVKQYSRETVEGWEVDPKAESQP
ncbi:DNA binding protein [Vreelandella jeotgali]|uniref:DNA binding protein n=1 Tax=Vreelandella jeotgali TaxID=553386 RepID=UPI000345FA15|nr:DNA binding protein [Halomonas jeotgali]